MMPLTANGYAMLYLEALGDTTWETRQFSTLRLA